MVIRYMLDTDACIALIKNRPEAMRGRLTRLAPEEVGISGIAAVELWFGVAHSLQPFWTGRVRLPLFTGNSVKLFRKKVGQSAPWISLSRFTPFFSMRFW